MADERPYQLVHSSKVCDSIRLLAHKSKTLGLSSSFWSTLLQITEKLVSEPEQWGDPLYATQKPGGKVYRSYLSPVIVHYTVYPGEHVVFLWDIRVLPDHPLAQ